MQRGQAHGTNLADLPELLPLEGDAENRRRKGLEDLPCEVGKLAGCGLAEIDQQGELGRIAPFGRQVTPQSAVEIGDVEAVERLAA